MKILYGHQAVDSELGPIVMTIGTYDGLHLGHQAIVERIVDRARKTGTKSLVYSFFPPPWRVLGKGKNPYLILTLQDKIDLMHDMGVDYLLTEEFTPDLQSISHTDFTKDVLQRRLKPQEIHVGYDFHFGRNRGGDWQFLRNYFADTTTEIRPHGAVRVDDSIVGCTLIRQHICEANLAGAAQLLGRYHFVRGVVVRGRGRGRTIGFPTANIDPSTELIPPAGVYAVSLQVGESKRLLPGIANLGFRPTFAEKKFAIEVHLFDWSGDLYGERVRVHFVDRVRDEMRFDGPDELVAQIHQDIAGVRAALPYPPPPESRVTWDPKPDKTAPSP